MHHLFLLVLTVIGFFEVAVASRFAKYLLQTPTSGSAETNVQARMNVSAVLSSEVKSDTSMRMNEPIQANVSIEDFWTPERIEEALRNPLPHPWERGSPSNRSKRHVAEDHFHPVLDSDYFRDMGIEFHEERIMHSSYKESAEVKLGDTTKDPFNFYGKLLIPDSDGSYHHCTAQVVGHSGILLTAAHCIVKDEHEWFKNILFYQQYDNGVGYKRDIVRLFVPGRYERYYQREYGDFRYDFAFCTLKPGSWASGYLGYNFNGPLSGHQSAVAAGYPRNSYNGKRLVWIKANLRASPFDQTLFMPANEMAGGCSGGAWLQGTEGDWRVVGINTFSIRGKAGMYSPKFDETIQSLFQDAKNKLLNGAPLTGLLEPGTVPPSRRRPCAKGFTYCGHERSGQGLDSNSLYHCDDADGTMTVLASCSSGCTKSGTSYCEPSGSRIVTSSCMEGYVYCGHEKSGNYLTANYLYRCSSLGRMVEIARCRNSCIYGGTSRCG